MDYRLNPEFSNIHYHPVPSSTLGVPEHEIYNKILFADFLIMHKSHIERGNQWIYQHRSKLPAVLRDFRLQNIFLTVRTNERNKTFLWTLENMRDGERLGSGMFVSSSDTPKRNDPEEGFHEDITASLALQGFGIYPIILQFIRQLLGPLRSDTALTPGAHKAWRRAGGQFIDNRYYLI